jgi:hypothetical protein
MSTAQGAELRWCGAIACREEHSTARIQRGAILAQPRLAEVLRRARHSELESTERICGSLIHMENRLDAAFGA